MWHFVFPVPSQNVHDEFDNLLCATKLIHQASYLKTILVRNSTGQVTDEFEEKKICKILTKFRKKMFVTQKIKQNFYFTTIIVPLKICFAKLKC